jgi:hypothetical protein
MRRVAALLLSLVLALEATQAVPSGLKIVVLEGEGAVNNIRKRTAREPVVEIRDQNERLVAGASVTFILPESGPSGIFPNASRMVTAVSDEKGQAAAIGLRPNQVAGEFQIRVTASHQRQTASASIRQTNVGSAAKGMSGRLVAIMVLAGGAAAGGVLIAGRGGTTGSKTDRPVLTPGTPEVGRPR